MADIDRRFAGERGLQAFHCLDIHDNGLVTATSLPLEDAVWILKTLVGQDSRNSKRNVRLFIQIPNDC
jgi:hypothetical protein